MGGSIVGLRLSVGKCPDWRSPRYEPHRRLPPTPIFPSTLNCYLQPHFGPAGRRLAPRQSRPYHHLRHSRTVPPVLGPGAVRRQGSECRIGTGREPPPVVQFNTAFLLHRPPVVPAARSAAWGESVLPSLIGQQNRGRGECGAGAGSASIGVPAATS